MQIGDIVARKSYNCDLYFRISDILSNGDCLLYGLNYRLKVHAHISDLDNVNRRDLSMFKRLFKSNVKKKVKAILKNREITYASGCKLLPGKILHLDSDGEYLNMCLDLYKELNVSAFGEEINENEQSHAIRFFLETYMPDILVITGHDSLRNKELAENLSSYKSSGFFIETVKQARLFNPSKDSLIIVAGACQSHYEALIGAGANVASSPDRVLIHAFDPLFVAERIAYTSVDKILSIEELIENNITGFEGMCGYQTRGTCRVGRG